MKSKWKEMSQFQRVAYIISWLCFLATLVLLLCKSTGALPGLYASSANNILLCAFGLGQAISAKEEGRVLLIILWSFLLLYTICSNTPWFDSLLNMRIT